MIPQNGTTIGLTVTTASDHISVDNNDDESILTRAPIETPKPSYQPSASTSSSSRYTQRTASKSSLCQSSGFNCCFEIIFQNHKKTEYMQEGVKNMCS